MHIEAYSILLPIVRSPDKNKPRRVKSNTIEESMNSSRENKFKDALIALYSSPDIPRRLFRRQRLTQVIHSLNPDVCIPNAKTMDSKQLEMFEQTLCKIQEAILGSEHIVLTFDGWSSERNESVIGFMVSFLGERLELTKRYLGNSKMNNGNLAVEIVNAIEDVVAKRLNRRIPTYFL